MVYGKRNPRKHWTHSAISAAKSAGKHLVKQAIKQAQRDPVGTAKRVSTAIKHLTKQEEKVQHAVLRLAESSQHNDMTCSYFKVVLGKKHLKKSIESYYVHQMNQIISNAKTGEQVSVDLLAINGLNQNLISPGVTFGTTTAGTQDFRWTYNPFDISPNQYRGGGVMTFADSAAPVFDRFNYHSCKGETMVTNAENLGVQFKMYYFTVKKSTGIAANTFTPSQNGVLTSTWALCLSDLQNKLRNAQATRATAGGAAAMNSPASGSGSINTYGESPFMHPTFRKIFKLLHVESHELQPGATKKIKFDFEMNKTFDKEQLRIYQANGNEWLPNVAIFGLLVAKATPVDLRGYTANTNICAPGPIKLLTTTCYRSSFSYPPDTKRSYNVIADQNFLVDSTIADGKIIVDTDAQATVTQTT